MRSFDFTTDTFTDSRPNVTFYDMILHNEYKDARDAADDAIWASIEDIEEFLTIREMRCAEI